jgi:anti-anti-sigma factor
VAHEAGATVSIQLHGECDLAGLPSIHQAISRALEAGPECIVLDLSRLRFIDSSGLHATIELANRSAAQNTRLVIIPGPPPVQRVFEISGVFEKLPFIGKLPNGSRVARPVALRSGASAPSGS